VFEHAHVEAFIWCGAYDAFWPFSDIARSPMDFRFRWKSGRAADMAVMAEFDPNPT